MQDFFLWIAIVLIIIRVITWFPSSGSKNAEYISNLGELQTKLVTEYFKLNDNIEICVGFRTSPQEILDIVSNRKVFPFQNEAACTVTQENYNYYIKLNISYTQGCKIFMTILRNDNADKLNELDKKVYEKIVQINRKIISPTMSNLQKERTIHDYLISTSKYDHENYLKDNIPTEAYTPYGLLFNHVCVCQAYAETFMIFMTLINIECYMVVGSTLLHGGNSKQDITHAWNIVKIDGRYFHVDVTFDNPIPDVIGRVEHNYFNVTDTFLDKTHVWKVNQYPICG